nr:hypothetical protein [uncultured Ruminococcus sp.]
MSNTVRDLVKQLYDVDDNFNDVYEIRNHIDDNNSYVIEVIIGYDDFSDPDILKLFTMLLRKCKEFHMKRIDKFSTSYLFTIEDKFIQEV